MTHTFSKAAIFIGLSLTGGWGCATEPNLTDIQKQVQTLMIQHEASHKQEQATIGRLETVESQLDEHDFLVGELIKRKKRPAWIPDIFWRNSNGPARCYGSKLNKPAPPLNAGIRIYPFG